MTISNLRSSTSSILSKRTRFIVQNQCETLAPFYRVYYLCYALYCLGIRCYNWSTREDYFLSSWSVDTILMCAIIPTRTGNGYARNEFVWKECQSNTGNTNEGFVFLLVMLNGT